MSFLVLPPELLLMIAERLESQSDLNALSQTSKPLYSILSDTLYQNNIKEHNSSALFWAATAGSIGTLKQALLSAADFNTRDEYRLTPLIYAAIHGHFDVARLLIQHGADFYIEGRCSKRPWDKCGPALHEAASRGKTRVVQLLLDLGADVNHRGGAHGHALEAAICAGDTHTVQVLVNNGANIELPGFYDTLLIAAAIMGNVDIALILLEHGANVNAQDGVLGPPLQAAADGGHTDVVQLFLDWNADVNAYGGYYHTALIAAREGEFTDIEELLLENGADPDVPWPI
ncbi:ankyrin repeat-containing domain protein [Aspergillus crustosus]